ncbi:MAG TPA: MotA/TolQ/ExbB proton channel family protein [Polyangia bacterium]|jgi:biopolymer transport protein ExbB/TolQ|nr:MotA/TolQ/ExbB proton channel family protein [Polyangia bacterium]
MDFTLVGLWHEMGFMARAVVVVLLAMSAYSLSIAIERLIAYRRGRALSRLYIEALAPHVESAARLREAVGLDKKFVGAPVATVVGAGVTEYAKSLGAGASSASAFDVAEAVNRTMERVKERELANLRRGLPVLATVASSAPFVGLFGTVGGIITAFQKLADPTKGGGGIGTVSAGIAEALITTAVGLGVAILTVWFYNFFMARLDDMTIDIDETASELVDSILKTHVA